MNRQPNQSNKTHFRKVFKSDHLGQADLEDYIESGTQLIFTIERVQQEIGVMVAGRKGNYNIAYFTDKKVKPLVLNAGNSKVVKSFASGSPFVEDWKNITIQLYIDPNVRMKGETVGGVRINPKQPKSLSANDLKVYQDLLKLTGTDESQLFGHLKINNIDSNNYSKAVNTLRAKQKKIEGMNNGNNNGN